MSATGTVFFVMIKPDGVKRGLIGEIISRFERRGFQIVQMSTISPDRKLIEDHYSDHLSKSFFGELINFTVSGSVVAIAMKGDVSVARKIVGSTIPWESSPGTIRGDYACTIRENLVHCSDSLESARREVELWFPELNNS
jgi:nucleoside-diphosphate kinase